jgi:prepilin-type N-terminal cleavage/methylation domain-containing protein
MARKYTILKVLIPNLNKGFTLIELTIGLLVMVIVGGLAMNSLVDASKSFSEDKRNIDSSQNLSAVLDLIGTDIKQSGELLRNDDNFPTIEIQQNNVNSSTLIVRRALTTPLTLCENILANDPSRTRIIVADNAQGNNCTPFPGTTPPNTPPTPTALPTMLSDSRNYRCKLGDINATYPAGSNFCSIALASNPTNAAGLQTVRIAMSDREGHIRALRYIDEDTSGAPNIYRMATDPSPVLAAADPNNTHYDIGEPIYLMEERQYRLNGNNLQVSIDGGVTFNTLISGIARFKVSARGYTNTAATPLSQKVINPNPPVGIACTAADGVNIPTTPTAENPIYGCKLNFKTNAADPAINWKMIAGVKVELQTQYEPTGGRNVIPNQQDLDKLTARAEFFPRNVLSK